MNRALILAEWRRARESLHAAELLTREGCFADAVSRTYYAVLHAAKAALQIHDVTVASHSAVKRMFGLHLIRTGKIEREWATHLGESLGDRLAADYDPEVTFTQVEARHECRQTRQFLGRIRRHLLDQGFTNAELRRIAT